MFPRQEPRLVIFGAEVVEADDVVVAGIDHQVRQVRFVEPLVLIARQHDEHVGPRGGEFAPERSEVRRRARDETGDGFRPFVADLRRLRRLAAEALP